MSTATTEAALALALADLIGEGSELVRETRTAYCNGRGCCVVGTAAVGALQRRYGADWQARTGDLWDGRSCVIAIADGLNVPPTTLLMLTQDLEARHIQGTSRAELAERLRQTYGLRTLLSRDGAP